MRGGLHLRERPRRRGERDREREELVTGAAQKMAWWWLEEVCDWLEGVHPAERRASAGAARRRVLLWRADGMAARSTGRPPRPPDPLAACLVAARGLRGRRRQGAQGHQRRGTHTTRTCETVRIRKRSCPSSSNRTPTKTPTKTGWLREHPHTQPPKSAALCECASASARQERPGAFSLCPGPDCAATRAGGVMKLGVWVCVCVGGS